MSNNPISAASDERLLTRERFITLLGRAPRIGNDSYGDLSEHDTAQREIIDSLRAELKEARGEHAEIMAQREEDWAKHYAELGEKTTELHNRVIDQDPRIAELTRERDEARNDWIGFNAKLVDERDEARRQLEEAVVAERVEHLEEERRIKAERDALKREVERLQGELASDAAKIKPLAQGQTEWRNKALDLQRRLDAMTEALRVVAKYFETASHICRECGWEHGEHHSKCPVPVVLAALTPADEPGESRAPIKANPLAPEEAAYIRGETDKLPPSAHQPQASECIGAPGMANVTGQKDCPTCGHWWHGCKQTECRCGRVARGLDPKTGKPAPQPATVTPPTRDVALPREFAESLHAWLRTQGYGDEEDIDPEGARYWCRMLKARLESRADSEVK